MGVNTYVSIFLFVLGAVCGSFLNVVIDRLPKDKSIISSRSHCDKCKKTLQWYDLVPLLSFLILKGKCRYCDFPIPKRVFFVELLTGLLFVFVFAKYGLTSPVELIALLFIFSSFLTIFFIDLENGIIPDQILLVSFLGALSMHIYSFFSYPSSFHLSLISYVLSLNYNFLLTAIVSFLFFLGIFLVTKGKGMGFGDVKFAFVIGFFLGFPKTLIAFYVAFLTGAIISLILVVIGKKKFHGGTIPFGPFMVFGTIAAFILREKILSIFPFL